MRASPSLSQLWQPHSRLCQLCRACEQQRSCSPGFCRKEMHATEGAVEVRRVRRRLRDTESPSPTSALDFSLCSLDIDGATRTRAAAVWPSYSADGTPPALSFIELTHFPRVVTHRHRTSHIGQGTSLSAPTDVSSRETRQVYTWLSSLTIVTTAGASLTQLEVFSHLPHSLTLGYISYIRCAA